MRAVWSGEEGDRPYLISIDIDKITLPNNQILVIEQCYELIKNMSRVLLSFKSTEKYLTPKVYQE